MRVLITGAAGKIATEIADELADHELYLVDKKPLLKQASITVDLAQVKQNDWRSWFKGRCNGWTRAFAGIDVVIHLAAEADPEASWEELLPNNIVATWNIIQTAADYHVPRVVFASSNWAVKALEEKLAPDCYTTNGPKLSSETGPSPTTIYGLTKGYGELAGQLFVATKKLQSFIGVRIGHFNPRPSTDEGLARLWIGREDLRSLFRRCVEAELTGFHVIYGISAQKTAPYDLTHTTQLLSWSPRQLP